MIDVNDKKIIQLFSAIHESAVKQVSQIQNQDKDLNDDILYTNRLFKMLCSDSTLEPRMYAEKMNTTYDYDLRGYNIITTFRKRHVSNPKKRQELFTWADELASMFGKALESGDEKFYQQFADKMEQNVLSDKGEPYRVQHRLGCLMLFTKYQNIDINHDSKLVEQLGDAYARYFLYDIRDALKAYCGMAKKTVSKQTLDKTVSVDEYIYRIEQLESELERKDMMLKDLQDEFEERIEENKTKELAEFFSRLNSERYGCILDWLLDFQKGASKLKKNHYEIPPEISGLFITAKNLIKFIKESNINPIMKPHEEKIVKFSEIESCDYEGTPFSSNDTEEEKMIKVISPGWKYTEKDLQISRPKVKEIV